jgi:iron-sulfur cluster repair protein YtfE (RIC family)
VIEDLWIRGNRELEAWRTAPLLDLVTHIIEHYHLGARVEMARIETFAEAACLLEAGDHPELVEIRNETARFCREFRAHMTMEERSLFPCILDLGQGQGRAGTGPVELMQPLKKLLEDEHQAEVGLFQRIRDLANDSALPPGPRSRLAHSLKALEQSLYPHIYLESQVLYRRVP